MASYRIFETDNFQRNIAFLSRSGQRRIMEKLAENVYPQLRREPHFGPNIKRLKQWEPPTWRYRIGAWRFFYEIEESERIVFMTAADHRGAAYR